MDHQESEQRGGQTWCSLLSFSRSSRTRRSEAWVGPGQPRRMWAEGTTVDLDMAAAVEARRGIHKGMDRDGGNWEEGRTNHFPFFPLRLPCTVIICLLDRASARLSPLTLTSASAACWFCGAVAHFTIFVSHLHYLWKEMKGPQRASLTGQSHQRRTRGAKRPVASLISLPCRPCQAGRPFSPGLNLPIPKVNLASRSEPESSSFRSSVGPWERRPGTANRSSSGREYRHAC